MPSDYFALFGMVPGIEIDTSDLTQKYLAKQREVHPDKNVDGAVESAELNKAYGVLKDRFKRAEYLLGELKADPEVLMEIMDLRENGAERGDVQEQVDELFAAVTADYKQGDVEAARKKYVKVKYLNKFLEDATTDS